ncbi:MAG: MarR family winged helix-turn-helix transcriptional regulator, partial [Acidimicrobiia bacterium]
MATSRAMRRAYDLRLAELGLNLSEAMLLAFVHQNGPLTQTRLADRLGMGRPATGAVVDALERRKLVERRRHTTDRRVWLVAATPTADRVVDGIDAIDQKLRSQLRAGISRAERQALAQTLLRLQANLAVVFDTNPGARGAPEN